MSITTKPIRCQWGRATRTPCTNPATVEVVGFSQLLLCEEHAAYEREDHLEGWEEFGAERYARYCEDAVNQLWELERTGNEVLQLVLQDARTYLEVYELDRARDRLVEAGGEPEPTATEREYEELVREYRARYGW